MDPEDATYKCTLSPYSQEKALRELNEDPKQRLGSVQTLRKWIKEQPHLTSRTDTRFLLLVLRKSKFSQLKARELIENMLMARTMFPEYMLKIDVLEPGVMSFIDKGLLVYLPKPNKDQQRIILQRTGYGDLEDPLFTPGNQIRCSVAVGEMYRETDEDVGVNGLVVVFDCTGFGPRHLARIPFETHRKIMKVFQDSNPERVKGFHFYNAGAVFDLMASMFKSLLKKKLQDRIRVHDTMESLYKEIPMELWPDEYLPDDYKGPSAGPMDSIQAELKKRLLEKGMRERILDITSERFKIDESKRPKDSTPSESFRKLNID